MKEFFRLISRNFPNSLNIYEKLWSFFIAFLNHESNDSDSWASIQLKAIEIMLSRLLLNLFTLSIMGWLQFLNLDINNQKDMTEQQRTSINNKYPKKYQMTAKQLFKTHVWFDNQSYITTYCSATSFLVLKDKIVTLMFASSPTRWTQPSANSHGSDAFLQLGRCMIKKPKATFGNKSGILHFHCFAIL